MKYVAVLKRRELEIEIAHFHDKRHAELFQDTFNQTQSDEGYIYIES